MKNRDSKILNRLRKGDIKSFESLFHQFHPGLFLYASGLLKDTDMAEEAVQEVFYHIWKNKDRITISTSWKSYLYKAVYNESMMVFRRQKREMGTELNQNTEVPAGSPDPFEILSEEDLHRAVHNTLETLPSRTREIFRMSRFEGLKYREIADRLTISVKTVEANMARALKEFRISLKEFGF